MGILGYCSCYYVGGRGRKKRNREKGGEEGEKETKENEERQIYVYAWYALVT